MKAEELLLTPYPQRLTRTHEGKIITLKSNIRWCSDAFAIRCWNGDLVHVAFAMECHNKEVISWVATTKGIDSELVCDMVTASQSL